MNDRLKQVLDKVFYLEIDTDTREFKITGRMFKFLTGLNGRKKVGDIARELNMDLSSIKEVLTSLIRQKLIKEKKSKVQITEFLKTEFFEYLSGQLSLAVGPLAGILIEDTIIALGHDLTRFPRDIVAELVIELSKEINREDKRMIFNTKMLEKINQLKN